MVGMQKQSILGIWEAQANILPQPELEITNGWMWSFLAPTSSFQLQPSRGWGGWVFSERVFRGLYLGMQGVGSAPA